MDKPSVACAEHFRIFAFSHFVECLGPLATRDGYAARGRRLVRLSRGCVLTLPMGGELSTPHYVSLSYYALHGIGQLCTPVKLEQFLSWQSDFIHKTTRYRRPETSFEAIPIAQSQKWKMWSWR
jgi:hypothetical protein